MADSIVLQLLMGPTLPIPVPAELSNALQSAQITTAVGSPSGFQLTFAVSKNSIITNALLPFGFFDPKIRVILMAIFNGTPHVLMDGVITQHELAPSNDPRESTFTVTGEDLTRLMDYEQQCNNYQGFPPELQVLDICSRYQAYGMVPFVVPPVLNFLPAITSRVPIQTSTDLEYLKQLSHENSYTFYLTPGPLPGTNVFYWGPEVRAGAPQPALSVNMDAATNVDSLTFSVDGNASTAFTASVRVPLLGIDVDVPIPDVSILKPPLSARPVAPLRKKRLDEAVARKDLIETMLVGLDAKQSTSDAVTAQGKLDVLRYGSILTARSIVGVRGAGLSHDGLYYVRKVTSDLKRGQFTQSFSLSREGLGSITPQVLV